ncbi:MAG: MerR family DNA-binding protein, partial [Raoultibacter sp.]
IQQLQSLGITLDEIKDLLDSHSIARLAEMLETHLVSIEEKLTNLVIAKQNALHLLNNYRVMQDKPICDQVILEQIGERQMMTFNIFNPRSLSLIEDTESFLQEWEINLRLTKKFMSESNIPLSLFNMVGCAIDREDLIKRNFQLKHAFVFVDDCALELVKEVKTIPSGKYLTLYKDHYTETDGSNAELIGLREILDFAEEHGFVIADDYYGEIVAETPAFLYEGREMLFKLQVRVTPAG